MFDDAEVMVERRTVAALVRLDAGRERCQRAARLLEALGGGRVPGRAGAGEVVLRFATAAARDEALEQVRSRFGWTAADAIDRRPSTSRPC